MKRPALSPAAIAAGLTVEKFVIGHAYARNGNAHNPTERVVWQVKQGRVLHAWHAKKGDAIEIANEIAAESK
jgi:hypothetical protein